MAIHDPCAPATSPGHGRIHAFQGNNGINGIICTFVDFLATSLAASLAAPSAASSAAVSLLVGSVLFFRDTATCFATWLFVIGSLYLIVKPTLQLLRELPLMRLEQTHLIIPKEQAQ